MFELTDELKAFTASEIESVVSLTYITVPSVADASSLTSLK